MAEIFGDFIEENNTGEFMVISFSPSASSPDRWRNNSISAEFLGDYWGTFLPVHDKSSQRRQTEVRDTVSYVSNELLENAVKFNYEPFTISIALYLGDDTLKVYVSNHLEPGRAEKFRNVIQMLLTEDAESLYIRQIENIGEDETDTESGLGLLTMLNDYDVELAWRFETVSERPERILTTTMASVAVSRSRNSETS